MSQDPYHVMKSEVEHGLAHARSLISSCERLRRNSYGSRTAGQQRDLREAEQELQDHLTALNADVADLEASVLAVEDSGFRWGISEDEVTSRRYFLNGVRSEVQSLQHGHTDRSSSQSPTSNREPRFEDVELGHKSNNKHYRDSFETRRSERDEFGEYEMEQQQMMLRQQDSTMDLISGTIATLASQAGLIGQEVLEQNEMLDDLSLRVESTDSKLTAANKRLRAFIRANEETKSTYCVYLLIAILGILLLLLILT